MEKELPLEELKNEKNQRDKIHRVVATLFIIRREIHTVAFTDKLPKCDFCNRKAQYDGRIKNNSQWAYMCEYHFKMYEAGLGLGDGQKLIVKGQKSK